VVNDKGGVKMFGDSIRNGKVVERRIVKRE
jgi:hypothetical protein